jgi:hypothetical protein
MSVIIDGSYGITPAQWTTANRPAAPTTGQSGYNTTLNQFEVYSGITWVALTSQTYSVSYLVVAGGGGGSYSRGGGGSSGSGGPPYGNGGNGGSGIVIIAYTGSQRGTGGTVTSSGGNTIHTFTSSGTYTA